MENRYLQTLTGNVVASWRLGIAMAASICGISLLWHPRLLAARFVPIAGQSLQANELATQTVARATAGVVVALGLAATIVVGVSPRLSARQRHAVVVVAAVVSYLLLTWPLIHWQVDDAGITFAYSENLVRGYGLVLHRGLAPEEAYSNTLWMLLLAAFRLAGTEIETAAKVVGTGIGVIEVALVLGLLTRINRNRASLSPLLMASAILLTAPFVIWSVSGLEHGLEALLLTLILLVLQREQPKLIWVGLLFVGVVLLRPEAPLLVGALASVIALYGIRRGHTKRKLASDLASIIVPPLVAFGCLTLFRVLYFGDPLPNPYYAKASGATFTRLANLVGVGWEYIWQWFRTGGIFVILPIVLLMPFRRAPLSVLAAIALGIAQLVFCIYAGGDWMSHWRFLCVVTPMLAVIVGYAVGELQQKHLKTRGVAITATIATLVVFLSTLHHLREFVGNPTTPLEVVSRIGWNFATLAKRLEIHNPQLAHHDAGGTSYRAELSLVDLGGLGNRSIAKHMRDRAFVQHYLLDQMRPDFIFGSATTFAAGRTRFYESEQFQKDYVRLEFAQCPIMMADLNYIRRDKVRTVPGLELVTNNAAIVLVRANTGCL